MATRILVVDDSPTIRRVVSTILEKHGYEPALASDGQDALEALVSGEVKTDLVLLDFVMPRMNGYQLCRALKDQAPELSSLPIVLMSAKGDRIRDQFVQQTGAIDAITKPFDAQALVAVIENALRKVNTARASSARLPEPSPFEGRDADDMPTGVGRSPASVPPPPVETDTRRTNVAQIVGQKLAQIAAKTLEEKPLARGAELERALGDRLANEAILEMVEAVRDLWKDASDGGVLAGDLSAIPIGAVLQLLQAENQTGTLHCRGGGVEIVATFRGGLIDLVQSSGASDEFRLGRYFVEEGILTPAEIDEVLKTRAAGVPASEESNEALPLSRVLIKDAPSTPDTVREANRPTRERISGYGPSGPMTIPGSPELMEMLKEASAGPRPLGTMLLSAGKIVEAQLRVALAKQSNELLYDVLRWTRGRFELRRDPPSELAEQARLGLPVASVVMEGFRRVDEWRVLERTLGSFDAVLVRDDAAFGTLDIASLPPREKMVLDLVDGERNVRQIVQASHQSSFDACRTLVQFLEARVLRRR